MLYQAEFMLPENNKLRVSIIAEALSAIRLVKIPDNPFHWLLKSLIPYLFTREEV